MKKVLLSAIVLLVSVFTASAQVSEPKETPQLEFALQLKVTLGETYQVGDTQHGQRIVIPITGGTFEGPAIKGTIINGGADYQLANKALNRTELEAIYSIVERMLKATLLSISKLHPSLRLLPIANMPGSTTRSSSVRQTSPSSFKVSS